MSICKTEHSNSRLCIGLQLQAQKLLMITEISLSTLSLSYLELRFKYRHGIEVPLNIVYVNVFLFKAYKRFFYFCHVF